MHVRKFARRPRRTAILRAVFCGGITALLAFTGAASLSRAQNATEPPKQGEALTKAIDTWTKSISLEQAQKLKDDEHKALLSAVTSAGDTLVSYERLDHLGAFIAEAARLKATFDDIVANDKKSLDVVKDANRIDSAAKDKDAQLTAIDQRGPQVFAALSSMKKILEALVPRLRINIVGAWYGDVDDIARSLRAGGMREWRDGPRFCSATAAVQAFCESQSTCFKVPQPEQAEQQKNSVTGTAQDITGPKLCGYDPVPYADDRAKALIVVYNCLALNDDIWRSQGEITWREINWKKKPPISAKGESDDPDYREDTAARFGASASGPFGAVLRNSAVGEIRCFRDLGQ